MSNNAVNIDSLIYPPPCISNIAEEKSIEISVIARIHVYTCL